MPLIVMQIFSNCCRIVSFGKRKLVEALVNIKYCYLRVIYYCDYYALSENSLDPKSNLIK